MTAATLILAVQAYLAFGAIVAFGFVLVGIGRIEPNARGAFVFRPLIIPGLVLIWPLVLIRWWQLETGRADPAARHRPPRALQGALALVLALLIPAIVFSALLARQDGPRERRVILLEAPE